MNSDQEDDDRDNGDGGSDDDGDDGDDEDDDDKGWRFLVTCVVFIVARGMILLRFTPHTKESDPSVLGRWVTSHNQIWDMILCTPYVPWSSSMFFFPADGHQSRFDEIYIP